MPDGGWRMANAALENAECGMRKGEWKKKWQMTDDTFQMADGGWQLPRRNGPTTFPLCQEVGGPAGNACKILAIMS
jgi:hypothetical protein